MDYTWQYMSKYLGLTKLATSYLFWYAGVSSGDTHDLILGKKGIFFSSGPSSEFNFSLFSEFKKA